MSDSNQEFPETRATDEAAAETLRIMGRRSLLKNLAKVGGVAAVASVLPSEWVKPVLDIAVLPAHAQLTQDDVTILNCDMDGGDGFFSSCQLTPARSGVSMTLTILVNGTETGSLMATTDPSGYASTTVDPFTYGWTGGETLTFRWSFTNPASGFGTCEQTYKGNDNIRPE
ncbi:MAG: hypothetical protein HN919_12070 [Verrucomicrobia bacterium]|jgi:hypothetical protein|nr:hypothetical protein [Verrucomicrobiota bacterium]MBT7067034.1 hypothetical protein [Verrucomicrobiota bacterium]MBT7700831.1 hypothetical protein [Verrucomicrobiota bacterium]